jgi:hypothetical protein
MFFYIETIFRDPDRQRSIKIAVEGKPIYLYIILNFVKNFLHVILFLGVGNIPEEIWSISKGCPPLPQPLPCPPPPP